MHTFNFLKPPNDNARTRNEDNFKKEREKSLIRVPRFHQRTYLDAARPGTA